MVLLLCVQGCPQWLAMHRYLVGVPELMRVKRDPVQSAVSRSFGFWDDSIRWYGFQNEV